MKPRSLSKKVKVGMVDMMEIFKDRKYIPLGLTKDEFISLFYKLPLNNVKKIPKGKIENQWCKIRNIKNYLIQSRQMAIIFKPMPRGTELSDIKFGKRILGRNTNIFFRCVEQENAWGYRNFLDKISKGLDRIGNNVVYISEQEEKQKEEEKAIEIIARH